MREITKKELKKIVSLAGLFFAIGYITNPLRLVVNEYLNISENNIAQIILGVFMLLFVAWMAKL